MPQFEDSNTGIFKRENWPKDEPETRPIWTNANDSIASSIDKKSYTGNKETIWRRRQEYQHDFAARMLWTTKNYGEYNHPPFQNLRTAIDSMKNPAKHFILMRPEPPTLMEIP